MKQSTPNYYAVIPATVRYDEDLSANAKLLYGEISALANSSGYCWSSNAYFADLYATTTRTVQRWLKSLVDREHIRIEVDQKAGNYRQIYLTTIKSPPSRQISLEGHDKNVATPHDKNVTLNNTVNNNTVNNKETYKENFKKFDFIALRDLYNEIMNRKTKVVNDQTKVNIKKALEVGYNFEDMVNTIKNARQDRYHVDTDYVHVTLEYCTRQKSLDKYSTLPEIPAATFKPRTDDYTK